VKKEIRTIEVPVSYAVRVYLGRFAGRQDGRPNAWDKPDFIKNYDLDVCR